MKTLGKLLLSILGLIVIVAVYLFVPFLFGAIVVALGAPTWVGFGVGVIIFVAFIISNRLKNR